jgi:hypothetical protein
MLWPRMPVRERIAAWVTWNLFFFHSKSVPIDRSLWSRLGKWIQSRDQRKRLLVSYRSCPISGAAFRFT